MHRRACTQARFAAAGLEGLQGAAQLIGLGPVFGVVDHGEMAAREGQRDIERLRLGARALRRHGDHRDRHAAGARLDGRARLAVVGFDGEDHVELLARIIEPLNGAQKAVDRSGLAIERGDHAVDRQLGIAPALRRPGARPL